MRVAVRLVGAEHAQRIKSLAQSSPHIKIPVSFGSAQRLEAQGRAHGPRYVRLALSLRVSLRGLTCSWRSSHSRSRRHRRSLHGRCAQHNSMETRIDALIQRKRRLLSRGTKLPLFCLMSAKPNKRGQLDLEGSHQMAKAAAKNPAKKAAAKKPAKKGAVKKATRKVAAKK